VLSGLWHKRLLWLGVSPSRPSCFDSCKYNIPQSFVYCGERRHWKTLIPLNSYTAIPLYHLYLWSILHPLYPYTLTPLISSYPYTLVPLVHLFSCTLMLIPSYPCTLIPFLPLHNNTLYPYILIFLYSYTLILLYLYTLVALYPSTFLSCSQMLVVFYRSVIHCLGFFIC